MFKSTIFIAVKCCQCSTMQVKQQKKSSNKWDCVVCNQKQSVTKIYAQGYQAKDIRNVVQSLNMSRKLEDELQQEVHSVGHFVEQLEGVRETEEIKGKRRADWSEYMEDDESIEPAYLKSKLNEEGMEVQANVVTEFSEDLIRKKARLRGKFGSSLPWIGSGKNQCYKPSFSKRVSKKDVKETESHSSNVESVWGECFVDDSYLIKDVNRHCEQQERNKVVKTGTSKWSQYMEKDDFARDIRSHSEPRQQQQPSKCMAMKKAGTSKWSEYMTGDDDDDDYGDGGVDKEVRAAFTHDLRLMCGYKLENDSFDQLIEEDIHPDFM